MAFRTASVRRTRFPIVFFAAAALTYVLDRVTKLLAERHLVGRTPIVLIPHVLDLRYTTNSGGAFGVLGSRPWIFFTATVVISAIVVVAAFRVTSLATLAGLGLILGGAVGNLTDRILHGPGVSGRVTDFLHFPHWPVFNGADSCIVIGALFVALSGVARRPE